MVRIAYFGTDGCPGHHVIPIRGKFTEEDIKVIESVDCDDFYKVFDVMRFKIAEFKGWTILGIPASLDDHRPGSKTVIFIEGEANEADFIEVTQEYSFLKNKVKKLAELYHDGEWLATGKLNQDLPTNKERFQLDKDDIINLIRGVDLDHITFKGDGKESFSFNRALVENLIETFEIMQNIYSDNYRLKVYTGNCIIQLNVNPKDPSESFFDVYDRDEMKLIYGIKISILKEMFII